eukprot:CAMPEP_0206480428 /NCGR_PEP_ID=MMETSP0324_2-20121206/37323_1 /ASSEMBLY_ACC=CAM_ASM_000836 /TAXON_ID=2866 /ORGANISM="Crypthecodinium cohnii, Strain Seligo" /LENGTH=239 /DNA_ID=CAMNT_0053957283 /DNA_START=85 /DNA_END=801 /DNA_ORIENTATION=-
MGWESVVCSCVGLVVISGGIALVVYGAIGGEADAITAEAESIDAGNQYTCTSSSILTTTDCRETEYCTSYVSDGNGGSTCKNYDPMMQCYCEAAVSFGEHTYAARFSITNTDMDGDTTTWCNNVLSGDTWPNFLAFNSDKSNYAYCGFRAYQDSVTIEGTQFDSDSACLVDAILDTDYKCMTTIRKTGFPCVQADDGRLFAGSKSDLVTQREDCTTISNGQQMAFLILGIILIVFGLVW